MLEPGSILVDRYEIECELGRGGFGIVYRAKQLKTGQLCAVKMMLQKSTEPEQTAEMLKRFRRETSLIAQMRSPFVVRLLDADILDDNPFMVLEYVEGLELAELLVQEGALEPKRAHRIAVQALEALAEAHQLGVVHRDLKPQNIMVTGGIRETAKVLDFGIAGLQGEAKTQLEGETITVAGQVRGTPAYIAPEQLYDFNTPHPQTDVYAMGLIILECLTGEQAVSGASIPAILHAQVNKPVEMPARIKNTMWGTIITKATAKDLDMRFADCGEMLHALEKIDYSGVSALSTGDLTSDVRVAVDTGNLTGTNGQPSGIDAGPPLQDGPIQGQRASLHDAPTMIPTGDMLREAGIPARGGSKVPLVVGLALLAIAAVVAAILLTGGEGDSQAATESAAETTTTATTTEATQPTPTDEPPARDSASLELAAQRSASAGAAARFTVAAVVADARAAARTARAADDATAASAAWTTVLAHAPGDIEALDGLGWARVDLGEHEKALQPLERVVAAKGLESSYLLLVESLIALERIDEAKAVVAKYERVHDKGERRAEMRTLERSMRKRRPKDDSSGGGGGGDNTGGDSGETTSKGGLVLD